MVSKLASLPWCASAPAAFNMHKLLLGRQHLLLLPRAQALARHVRRFHPQLLQLLAALHVLQKQLRRAAKPVVSEGWECYGSNAHAPAGRQGGLEQLARGVPNAAPAHLQVGAAAEILRFGQQAASLLQTLPHKLVQLPRHRVDYLQRR